MRTTPVLAGALLFSAAAHAQIHEVSRVSHLIADYSWFDEFDSGGYHYDETMTEWASQLSRFGAAQENLVISRGSIRTDVQLGGSSDYNMMQHSGFSLSSSYSGSFTFDLRDACDYTLSGTLSCGYGTARVRLFDAAGAALFDQRSQPLTSLPFATSGSLTAGRYRLLVEGEGVPVGGRGPGDAYPSAILTVIPAPASLPLLALPLLTRRRRPPAG